jgi:fructose-1,6-bisphosphatase
MKQFEALMLQQATKHYEEKNPNYKYICNVKIKEILYQ